MTNPTVVVGGTVSGNVGSCSVVATDISVNPFMTRSIGVNSCSGEIVADYTHLDGFALVFGGAAGLFLGILAIGIALGILVNIFSKH